MKRFYLLPTLIGMMLALPVLAKEKPMVLDFSETTVEKNQVTLQGAGFGQYPQAEVTFGFIPTDNAFDGATDGLGAIVTAKPGEGVIVFGQKIVTSNAAIVRCTVRTDQPHASIIIATIGEKPGIFISSNYPSNEAYFTGRYLRLQTVCSPPSMGFQPLIQLINTSETESLTAYLDNFEVYFIDPNKFYNGSFLDGDEIDPPADAISIPSDPDSGEVSPSDLTVKVGQVSTNINIEMVLIPAGTFTMGSPENEEGRQMDEGPLHQVTILNPFFMGKYEVTQAQWQAVMGSNPSNCKGNNLPVEQVSWNDCQTFIQKLNQLGQGTFRLPTEAEWEYACRAGSKTAFFWGDDTSYKQTQLYAWFDGNSGNNPHPVGSKSPNAWGLYDMSGNVWEWCQDWYGEYGSDAQTDPVGANFGSFRIYRGGGWCISFWGCRSADRDWLYPSHKNNFIGLRVCMNP